MTHATRMDASRLWRHVRSTCVGHRQAGDGFYRPATAVQDESRAAPSPALFRSPSSVCVCVWRRTLGGTRATMTVRSRLGGAVKWRCIRLALRGAAWELGVLHRRAGFGACGV
jgi:hypothetical protein